MINLFDCLNNLTSNDPDLDFNDETVKKVYDIYMINRYVSMCELYIPFISQITILNLTKEDHYRILKRTLPKRKQFFKYLTKNKDFKELKEMIIKYYNIGEKEAEIYLHILRKEDIDQIVEIFKSTEKQKPKRSKKS